MSHRNFDQALEGAQVAQIDATFDLGGREWHLAPMPDYLLMKWVSATGNAGRAGLLMQQERHDEARRDLQRLESLAVDVRQLRATFPD